MKPLIELSFNQGGSGRTSSGQIVEVNVGGSWGSLCDDSFTMVEANLVCKQMGYHLGAKEVRIGMKLFRAMKFEQSKRSFV